MQPNNPAVPALLTPQQVAEIQNRHWRYDMARAENDEALESYLADMPVLLAAYDAQAAQLRQARDRVAGLAQELGEQEVEKLRLIRELAAAIAAPTEQP